MTNPASQQEQPLSPDVLRLVEGIARTLAREDHDGEIAGQALPKAVRVGSDGPLSTGHHP